MALNYKPNKVSVDLMSYRHYIRGSKKVGKTTLFYNLINTLYNGDMSKGLLLSVGSESGYQALDGLYAIEAPTWSDFIEIVDDLCENKHENTFDCIAVDTVDELCVLAENEVCRRSQRESGNKCTINGAFGGYGAGRRMVAKLIDDALARLGRSGYGLFYIGHVKEKTTKEKNGDEYQQLVSNLAKDYDDIFANKADVIVMIDSEKTVSNNQLTSVKRYMHFRADNYYDCGTRFSNIEDKIELSAQNYINAVTNAIKSSIKSVKADDKYIEEKKAQEKADKEAYYQEHKEELSSEEAFDEANNIIEETVSDVDNMITEINNIMKNLSQTDRDNKKEALTSANLPASPAVIKKLTDVKTLTQILNIVKA